MYYKRLSNEELKKYPYPNLMAELIESGYSICTLANHMEIGEYRQQGDPEVWAKLRGEADILTGEAFGLSGLFSVSMEYLFSHELKVFNEKPAAYWRWLAENQKREKELEEIESRDEIMRELRRKPYLLEFMKAAAMWSKEELQRAVELLEGIKEVPTV